jgi:hypothetical protein
MWRNGGVIHQWQWRNENISNAGVRKLAQLINVEAYSSSIA